MNSVDIMVKEHDYILELREVVHSACEKALETKKIDIRDFRTIIDFIRVYADKHHHGKEEEIFFKEMAKELGNIGENLITYGMLVEHDLGRLYIIELEQVLDDYEKENSSYNMIQIIANAVGYTNLIKRHIEKENTVVYVYGKENFNKELIHKIDKETLEFEQNAEEKGIQKKYIKILDELKKKYIE